MSEPEPGPQSGEDRLIARYFRPLATHPGALGLVDDAATFTPSAGADLVLTTDALVGGVHFFTDDPAEMASRTLTASETTSGPSSSNIIWSKESCGCHKRYELVPMPSP